MVKRYRGGLITANLALTVVGNRTNARMYSFTEYGKARATGLTFGPPPPTPMQVLLVAGGGSGGSDPANADGGGGGAGGFLEYSNISFAGGVTYTIYVGAGGTSPGTLSDGSDGSNTLIVSNSTPSFNYIAYGGGGGGTVSPTDPTKGAGRSGGSGGGSGAYNQGKITTGSGVPGQGFPGGLGTEQPGVDFRCGGGGGAGQAGQTGPNGGTAGGPGGYGKYSVITGSNVSYSGGGAGYAYTPGATIGLGRGGTGGGGGRAATNPESSDAPAGSSNRGGGGATNGNGGSGTVVLRYPTAINVVVETTGSPNVIYADSNVIYRFWQSGTIALF